MYICPECDKDHDTLLKISKHLQAKHQLIPKDILFELYPELFRNCKECGLKIKQYITDSQSRKFCGAACELEWRTGKTQSQETVAKRIKNTDQKNKEKTRKNTMMETYGVDNPSQLLTTKEIISKAHKGKKRPRTAKHQQKIVDAKIANGTSKHTQKTKDILSLKISSNYQSDNPPNSMPKKGKGGRGFINGTLNGHYYRSSYEKQFIQTCFEHNIKLETAETKEFRVPYIIDGKNKLYYPDFYLPEYSVIIEIKPSSLLNDTTNEIKLDAAMKFHENFIVITEEELFDKQLQWVYDLEYFLS